MERLQSNVFKLTQSYLAELALRGRQASGEARRERFQREADTRPDLGMHTEELATLRAASDQAAEQSPDN